ncbi:MAG: hypothetical protein ACQEXJ_05690 [Myxococcota bacterium]
MARETSDRRGFLARAGGWALGGLALWLAPGCDSGRDSGLETDDFGMHGPVEVDHEILRRPSAADALPLFAPHDDGTPFLRRWAIAHVTRERREQVVVVLVDLETGGHAQLGVWARDPDMRPVAHSERYGVYVDNGGRGAAPTPRHLRRVSKELARTMARNEHRVTLARPVPRLRDAPPLDRQPVVTEAVPAPGSEEAIPIAAR